MSAIFSPPAGIFQDYVPAVTAFSGTLTSYTITAARWCRIGKLIFVHFDITITDIGSGATAILLALPATQLSGNAGTVQGMQTNASALPLYGGVYSNKINIFQDNFTFPAANGTRLLGVAMYEAA